MLHSHYYIRTIVPREAIVLLCLILGAIKTTFQDEVEDKCRECNLTSRSIEEIIKLPRQMNSYGNMEERIDLEKIKKRVCTDISNDVDREKCRHFYFTQLPTIQRWKHSKTKTSFFDHVCIRELKVCCPRNSFGPKCSKCSLCPNNQECHGEGTRQGNGTCVCKQGYTGHNCNFCIKGYYQDTVRQNLSKIETKRAPVICSPCHRSCEYCREGGPQGCDVCKAGFTFIPGYGCGDIDECINSNNKICGENTFCVNTEGSYFCYECDRACDGCHGDGPDMCLKCGNGYKLDAKGNCVALKKTILPPEANYYRYAIYTGLLICAGIIFHNNIYWASFIGLAVALYIGFSEYIMSTHLHDMSS